MKIGVITFCFSKDNYGQILQCYALQKHLTKNGFDSFLINYKPDFNRDQPKFRIKNIFNYISRFSTYFNWWLNNRKQQHDKKIYEETAKNENRRFDEFLSQHISITESLDKELIKNNPPIADAYICGSDQIWGIGGDWPFYLSFAPVGKKRIAYAPSMGGIDNIPKSVKQEMISHLSKFSFIGMREKSGQQTISNLGIKDVMTVIDPTMLLTSEDYSKIAKLPDTKKEYVFVYLLGKPSECKISEIFSFIRKHGLEPVYVASGGQNDNYPKTYATIEEWIGYISKARFVITNSFHCTVFALLHKVPFASILLNNGYERMNCRVEELLENCRLSDHIYRGNLDRIFNSSIAFDGFNRYREKFARESSELLFKAIGNPA